MLFKVQDKFQIEIRNKGPKLGVKIVIIAYNKLMTGTWTGLFGGPPGQFVPQELAPIRAYVETGQTL